MKLFMRFRGDDMFHILRRAERSTLELQSDLKRAQQAFPLLI